jgi:hypothetical protein
MTQVASYMGTQRRRRRNRRHDPRTKLHIVHSGFCGVSEFPSAGELLAYLWKGIKARRQLPRTALIRQRTGQSQEHLGPPVAQTFALR